MPAVVGTHGGECVHCHIVRFMLPTCGIKQPQASLLHGISHGIGHIADFRSARSLSDFPPPSRCHKRRDHAAVACWLPPSRLPPPGLHASHAARNCYACCRWRWLRPCPACWLRSVPELCCSPDRASPGARHEPRNVSAQPGPAAFQRRLQSQKRHQLRSIAPLLRRNSANSVKVRPLVQ